MFFFEKIFNFQVLTEKDLVANFDTGINRMNLIDEKENINSLGRKIKVKKDTKLEVLAQEVAAKIHGDKSVILYA